MDSGARNYYKILGLQPGASLEEIRAAYKDLVKVWHPDRFHDDPPLREKAEEKLKEINEAYQYLLVHRTDPEPPPGRPGSLGGVFSDPDPERSRPVEASRTPAAAKAPRKSAREPRLAKPYRRRRARSDFSWPRVAALFVVTLGVLALSITIAPFVLGTLLEPPGARPADPQAGPRPVKGSDSVLLLVTLNPSRAPEYGTAFLVDRATAMTASHVLISAARPRARLLAVTPDHHAYRAHILCRVPLAYHDYPGAEVAFSKDVALVGIEWDAPDRPSSIERLVTLPGDLPPAIYPLRLSPVGPRPGDLVVIVGYGQGKKPTPERLKATGVISQIVTAKDGAAVFSARLLTHLIPGEGGAPVLNGMGEVVGLWAWETNTGEDDGAGVAVPSLTCP